MVCAGLAIRPSLVLFVGVRVEEEETETTARRRDRVSSSGVSITFSTSLAETELPAVQQVIDTFQETSGATVELTQVDSATLPQKLQVEVDSGNHTIHLFAQDNLAPAVAGRRWARRGSSDVEIPEGVNPALIPEQFDGVQYFLPYRPNVKVVYVNKSRFEEAGATPPTTVDEFMTTAEELKDGRGTAEGRPPARGQQWRGGRDDLGVDRFVRRRSADPERRGLGAGVHDASAALAG